MKTSESINDLLSAMLKVQAALPDFTKSATNPHFGSSYLPLEALMKPVLPILRENGLLLIQQPADYMEGHVGVTTTIYHVETGQYMSNTLYLPMSRGSAQDAGSCITYARRYSLEPLLGIVGQKDDDGNAAARGNESPKRNGKPKQAPALV